MIYDHSENKDNRKVTVADSGYMRMTADERNLILTLYNGYTYEEIEESKRKRPNEKEHPHQRQKFEKQIVTFELTGLDFNRTDEGLFKNNFQMFNLKQLEYAEDSLKITQEESIKRFKRNLTTTEYFKREKSMLSDYNKKPKKRTQERDKKRKNNKINQELKIVTDTLSRNEEDTIHKPFSPDSVYNHLDNKNKDQTLQYALNYARAAHNNISNSKKTFNYKSERIRRHQIEWHRKFSLSFACLVFFLIGAPFGAIVRKGGFGTPLVVSILFFILYYILSISGEKFAREGIVPAYFGMWLSSFILMPLGIFLTYKATTDSVILNADSYLLFFKKIFQRFSKKSTK
jgi:lipopolysaccharide export system permease protein